MLTAELELVVPVLVELAVELEALPEPLWHLLPCAKTGDARSKAPSAADHSRLMTDSLKRNGTARESASEKREERAMQRVESFQMTVRQPLCQYAGSTQEPCLRRGTSAMERNLHSLSRLSSSILEVAMFETRQALQDAV